MSRSPAKRALFSGLTLVVAVLLVEATSYAALWGLARVRGLEYAPVPVELLPKHHQGLERLLAGETGMASYHPVLGWGPPAGLDTRYRTNRDGIRGPREVMAEPAPGTVRIATFGDSFTFGDDSSFEATFQERLRQMDPRLDVLNFGVPGYGLDQAFLRYQEQGPRFHPQIVFIGFLSENIHRGVNTFRPFYFHRTGLPLTKPRFVVRGDELVLLENPFSRLEDYRRLLDDPEATLRELGRHDYFYGAKLRPGRLDAVAAVRLVKLLRQELKAHDRVFVRGVYNREAEPFAVTIRLFDAFADRVRADGALPVAVIFPTRSDLEHQRKSRPKRYQPLLDHLAARELETVDLMGAFEEYTGPLDRVAKSHYTHPGNRRVAEYLHAELTARGLIPPLRSAEPGPAPPPAVPAPATRP